jgi:hypothetical protein
MRISWKCGRVCVVRTRMCAWHVHAHACRGCADARTRVCVRAFQPLCIRARFLCTRCVRTRVHERAIACTRCVRTRVRERAIASARASALSAQQCSRAPPAHVVFVAQTSYLYYRDMEADKLATLEEWFGRHIAHPYPKGAELAELARAAGLPTEQVRAWPVLHTSALAHARTHELRAALQVIVWMRKKRAREKYESRSLQDEKSRASIAAALARRMSTQAERVDEHVITLRRWIDEHTAHPYPTAAELHELCAATLLNGDEVRACGCVRAPPFSSECWRRR